MTKELRYAIDQVHSQAIRYDSVRSSDAQVLLRAARDAADKIDLLVQLVKDMGDLLGAGEWTYDPGDHGGGDKPYLYCRECGECVLSNNPDRQHKPNCSLQSALTMVAALTTLTPKEST
jgi:hypothetical protein